MKKGNMHAGYAMSGKYARTPKGFQDNIKHMKKEGYSEKRAVGTAYGEADMSFKGGDYDKLMKRVERL